jgi:hypothetical protein
MCRREENLLSLQMTFVSSSIYLVWYFFVVPPFRNFAPKNNGEEAGRKVVQ